MLSQAAFVALGSAPDPEGGSNGSTILIHRCYSPVIILIRSCLNIGAEFDTSWRVAAALCRCQHIPFGVRRQIKRRHSHSFFRVRMSCSPFPIKFNMMPIKLFGARTHTLAPRRKERRKKNVRPKEHLSRGPLPFRVNIETDLQAKWRKRAIVNGSTQNAFDCYRSRRPPVSAPPSAHRVT